MSAAYEVVIGLEVHVELKTATKLFCGCANAFGQEPNTETCPVCLGMPGVLPVLNGEAVSLAARAALALHCEIHSYSKFDRKQYFYPDLPKAYQISQYDQPLAESGYVEIGFGEGKRKIGIERIHLEEDAGKLNHIGNRLGDATGSLVDLNRAGVPLIEIVSRPQMHSPEEARQYLTELKTILSYLDISDLRMEEGSMRCDANISLKPSDYTGSLFDLPRVEIKNVNSFRNVQRGIEYEIGRQKERLAQGLAIVRETRGFDDASGTTYSQRSKEEANDYRYFPEPDLPPLVLSEEWLAIQQHMMPELPDSLRAGLLQRGVAERDVQVLVQDPDLYRYWQQAVAEFSDVRQVTNWILSDYSRLMNAHSLSFAAPTVTAKALASLLRLIESGTLSGKMAKEVLEAMFESGETPQAVVKRLGLIQITDQDAIRDIVSSVVMANPAVVKDFLGGKDKALAFLVGQVMKQTKGQAKPDLVNDLLREVIATYA